MQSYDFILNLQTFPQKKFADSLFYIAEVFKIALNDYFLPLLIYVYST